MRGQNIMRIFHCGKRITMFEDDDDRVKIIREMILFFMILIVAVAVVTVICMHIFAFDAVAEKMCLWLVQYNQTDDPLKYLYGCEF